MNELEELKKELEEVLEKVNAKLEEDEEKYWAIDDWGDIRDYTNDGDSIDKFNREIGNYFKTKKEAEECLEDLKVKTEIKNIAKELNEGKEIDWGDGYIAKFYLYYDYNDGMITMDKAHKWEIEGVTFCLNPNFKDECIERIGLERLENYLKRN